MLISIFGTSGHTVRLCKNNNAKINCESTIGQHLITNPECAKTSTDHNFRMLGQARLSYHSSALESVYIKATFTLHPLQFGA